MAKHKQHEQAIIIIIDNAGGVRLRLGTDLDYILPLDILTRPALSTLETIHSWIDDCETAPAEDWDEDHIVARWQGPIWQAYPDPSSHAARRICGLVCS